jgi:hypothetical protein
MGMSSRSTLFGASHGVAAVVMGFLGWAGLSCAPAGFKDQSQIESVRIMASSADKPYAKPGDQVTLSVLAFDGRAVQPEPMTIYWLPFVCENPIGDAYFACFAQLGMGGMGGMGGGTGAPDGGAPAPGGGIFKPGLDLTPLLPVGPTYSFTMPADAITTHTVVQGQGTPYGIAFVFNAACAGHLEIVPFDTGNPQQPPIGCFDSNHNALGPEDWVFGFTRVYAYDKATNANPVISGVDVGKTKPLGIDPATGAVIGTFEVPHCAGSCSAAHVGPVVPASSQETQTQMSGSSPQREEIWVDFYSTLGTFGSEARLLYDPSVGSIGGPGTTDDDFNVPSEPGEGFLWMVVHDNRGGATWATVPLHVN